MCRVTLVAINLHHEVVIVISRHHPASVGEHNAEPHGACSSLNLRKHRNVIFEALIHKLSSVEPSMRLWEYLGLEHKLGLHELPDSLVVLLINDGKQT